MASPKNADAAHGSARRYGFSGNRTEPGKTLYGTRQLIASEDGREVRKTRAPVGH